MVYHPRGEIYIGAAYIGASDLLKETLWKWTKVA